MTGQRVVVWDTGDVAGSGLFTTVKTDDAVAEGFQPDWVVESRTKPRPYFDPIFDVWFLTKISLGIIPTVRTDDEAIEYAIRRADEPVSASRRVSFTVPRDEVCGWFSYLLALLPSWSGDYEVERKRFSERLAAEIVKSGVLDEPPPAR